VAANQKLIEALKAESHVKVLSPPPNLCTDNGAMIAAAVAFFSKQTINL